jgi:hypothetical protein
MYLILDTQSWIYLANGYNQATREFDGDLHFRLLCDIVDLIDKGKLKILINEVILMEWERNQKAIQTQIEKIHNKIRNERDQIRSKKKRLLPGQKLIADFELKEFEEFHLSIIKKNEEHILKVDNLLKIRSINIPIKTEHKLQAVDIALKKEPPFHRKNNSVGDALILISTSDYLSGERYEFVNDSIFVSNNTDDYSEEKGSKIIHPKLKHYFDEASMHFETNLARALSLGEEIIKEIDDFNHYMYDRDSIACQMNCKGSEYGMDEVEFNEEIEVKIGDFIQVYDPDQLRFDFGKEFEITQKEIDAFAERDIKLVDAGRCNFCNTLHIRCECGEEHAITYENGYVCDCGCGLKYLFEGDEISLTINN